jgi:integrase/recombinase XerD
MSAERTPARKKARELAKYLRAEQPDYAYLKSVFYHLRRELEIAVPRAPQSLPAVPSEEEIGRYYAAVWEGHDLQDAAMIKLLLYTGVRVGELVNIKLGDVDLGKCQIRITDGKGGKDRVVPFPAPFGEVLAHHMKSMAAKRATYLFESSWKRKYSERGVREIVARYGRAAGLAQPISPHKLRHFLLTWLKKQGIDDALIQPYSGHESRQSLAISSRLSLTDAQQEYDQVMGRFPVQ